MKKTNLLIILISFLFIISCEKDDSDDYKTYAEIIALELQSYIDNKNPELASAYIYDYNENEWVNDNNGMSCGSVKVESPFIVVCDIYYNLENLVKYEPGYNLKLYFEY
jgi:hypothetical protein